MSNTFKIVLVLLIVVSLASAVIAVIGFMGKEREYMKRLIVEDKLAFTLKEKLNLEKELEVAKSAKEQAELKVSKTEEKIKEISAQLDDIKQKGESAIAELDAKKAELAKMKVDLDIEKKEKLSISKKLETIQADYDKAKKEALRLSNEKAALEKEVRDLQAKQSVNLDKIVVNTDEDAAVPSYGANAVSRSAQDVGAAQGAVATPLQGTVLVVNKEYSFIVSDIGQDRNIQKGMKFDVMDGTKFLGQAEIDKVYDTMSSATVLSGGRISEMKKGNVIVESR